jgi:hypothetical protein
VSINFTVNYDLLASQTDSADAGIDSDLVALIGTVVFTPLFADNRAVLAPTRSPRPAGLKLQPISGYLDSDGRLKASPGGVVGVRLPAKDPIMDLDTLFYRVDFNVRTPSGEPVRLDAGFFQAPTFDLTVDLAVVMQSALSSAASAPRLIRAEFDPNDRLVFENADGSLLSPIEIPTGIVVFTDNGDSTWTWNVMTDFTDNGDSTWTWNGVVA